MAKVSLRDILRQRDTTIEIRSGTETHNINLADELHFSTETIREDVECQAGMVAWYGSVLSDAEKEVRRAEREFDIWYARTYNEHFVMLSESGKKPSIASVENSVRLTREYEGHQTRIDVAKGRATTLRNVCDWWKEKGIAIGQFIKLLELEYKSLSDPKGETSREDYERAEAEDVKRLQDKMNG